MRVIRLKLIAESPISISNEREPGILRLLTSPIVMRSEKGFRVQYKVPIVPSSAAKGVFRKTALSLLKPLGLDVREHEEEPRVHHKANVNERTYQRYVSILKEIGYKHVNEKDVKEEINSILCPMCLLFGNKRLAGSLRFTDFIPSSYSFTSLKKVKVDRGLGVRRGEATKFEVSIVDELVGYAILYFNPCLKRILQELEAESVMDKAIRLWESTLSLLKETGLEVGALSSSGQGFFKLEVEEASLEDLFGFVGARNPQSSLLVPRGGRES